MRNQVKTIAFDADDTLWISELYFQEAENKFCELLKDYLPQSAVSAELYSIEMKNLHLYGYGVKGFTLCMIETILRIAGDSTSALIEQAIRLGQELLQKPVELLPGVKETLTQLSDRYTLVMATKGDLLDQERKLKRSGLEEHFHHITIMSDKQPANYVKLLKSLDCAPANFLMVGNSIKSDILPALNLGASAAYIPYEITWLHEQHAESLEHPCLYRLKTIDEILKYLD